jgi:hypothetical protein
VKYLQCNETIVKSEIVNEICEQYVETVFCIKRIRIQKLYSSPNTMYVIIFWYSTGMWYLGSNELDFWSIFWYYLIWPNFCSVWNIRWSILWYKMLLISCSLYWICLTVFFFNVELKIIWKNKYNLYICEW